MKSRILLIIIFILVMTGCAERNKAQPTAIILTRETAAVEVIEVYETTETVDETDEIDEISVTETTESPKVTTVITISEPEPEPTETTTIQVMIIPEVVTTAAAIITTPEIVTAAAVKETVKPVEAVVPTGVINVILNKNSGTYHLDSNCTYVQRMNEENKSYLSVNAVSELSGYKACSRCADGTSSNVETVAVTAAAEKPVIADSPKQDDKTNKTNDTVTVIVNINSLTFHIDHDCRHVKSMKDENKSNVTGTVDEIINSGYKACGTCSKAYKN